MEKIKDNVKHSKRHHTAGTSHYIKLVENK